MTIEHDSNQELIFIQLKRENITV